MNLLLLEDGDFIAADRVLLSGRRLKHLHEVHRAEAGDSLRVGRLNGLMGSGQLLRLDAEQAELYVQLDQPPPEKLPLTLLLALPRPKMLRRVLQTVSSMGVPRLILLNSYRVEKSFWQTPFLQPDVIRENLLLGLEQARDTVLPKVRIEKRFKPFVEDSLPDTVEISHISLFDGSVEGLRHKNKPVFCVQYHPESSPGPHDSRYLFDRFAALMDAHKAAKQ